MQREEELNELDSDDGESVRGAKRVRAQPSYKRTPRPKQRGSSVSFNGIHRRRKKKVTW